ncbi:DUF7009 family protein [Mucilaginibacter aquaedulcis]|uniref:DUF7009 family protein n=1 Tax=Mucilaginibacter aquaedulcis TaxID=1187081 RepID=UPI0025B4E5CB|nr:hypothetical protein [Mucilaginibacter aquaedulcis]MDN3550673.1 hypothetical protein [Mucilaginibacter aquaedulcis]
MKIRIKGDSLRYRLTKSDVNSLAGEGYIQEQTNFLKQSLTYAIKTSEGNTLKAEYINNVITLFIPGTMITELANTDKVGFEEKEGPIYLLVEKDFTCLDNVDEDQSDNYPNPLLQKN